MSKDLTTYDNIKNMFNKEESKRRFATALCITENTPVARKAKVQKYIDGVLQEIYKNIGDDKKDITKCTPQSILQSALDAATYGLTIDGRQYAHLIKYGNECTLQVGYRGYLAKLEEAYKAVSFTVEPVYEGDDFKVGEQDGQQKYQLVKKDPFRNGTDGMRGVFAHISYIKDGVPQSKITTMSLADINKIKGCAKQKFIWDQWFMEKAKAACIKRAAKVHFASLNAISDLVAYDNNEHFDMEKQVELDRIEQKATVEVGDELAGIATDDEFSQDAFDIEQTTEEK